MNIDVEAQLRSLVNFPSPPGVVTHIIELARDPEIELSKVAKALSLDSALSTKVLRIANSPLYAQRRKSENLRQALVVLGLNATLTLALSFSLVKALRAGKPNGISYPLYWRRALLAATSARALADAMHHPLGEEIFLAGLLQDIGLLAVDQALPDLYPGENVQRNHASLEAIEKPRLQTGHDDIGAWLMRNWHMPDRLCQAIARSHRVDLFPTVDPNQVFERCVSLSGLVADLFLQEASERRFAEIAQTIERSLGLDKMAFGQVLGTISAMIPETQSIFESDPLTAQHPEVIIEQAREVLMLRSLHALREIDSLRTVPHGLQSGTLELEEEARRDPLTGVYNRAWLHLLLGREFETAARQRWPLSVAFADLDGFERINHRYGREAGDRILQATARILRSQTRETDLIARYSGEEFAVVLPATDSVNVNAVCEQIVAVFRNTGHVIGAEEVRVSVSIGCATQGEPAIFDTPDEFIKAAGAALQAAKKRGRNCAVSFDHRIQSTLIERSEA